MSQTDIITRPHPDTGMSDSAHSSSSSSAERYALNEADTTPILLYKYRGGLDTSTQKELCAYLDKNESLRATRKHIPRWTSYVDIQRHDLYLPTEKNLYASYPNYNSNLASVKVPALAYWSRLLLGNYQDLFIVSPESSPASSQADEESRRASPTNTWAREDTGESEET
ncbi:hypothetical protein BDY17DRAFT_319714 [Neohortaea acidophila]|uniref:Uncharacterized protein n=1 Tax=Neohortaea acidophila TaxID=245834 RepID=A0A6A6Q4D7_9PEZI|nr:uncharacterized protein BDY17DRAFT_319714 [Neohortaea acidophila]KAF2487152.1 hypothetical protein BDY17DRAFT_319714 [Neohortaea acidophila]